MTERIAIVGLSSLLPGSASSEQFWDNLVAARDCCEPATEADFGCDPEPFRGSRGERDKAYCLRGGYVRGLALDAASLGVSEAEFARMDRAQRWSLHLCRDALRDAGYLERTELRARCGVVLGNLSFPTLESNELFLPLYRRALARALAAALPDRADLLSQLGAPQPEPAGDRSALLDPPAATVATQLALGAGHFTLDAACASAFYAIELASELLRSGQADMMIAGAVSAADPLFVAMGFSIFQAYPEDGSSTPLDQRSKGLVAAEGGGVVVLKRLSDALRDGDKVLATILGVGLSNDGHGKSVLSPNPKGQVLCYERAYRNAGVSPSSIDYVECHATGTPLGDRTELESLEQFFEGHGHAPKIGAVKGNVGHLLSAAGMPSLIKVLLSMARGRLPPTRAAGEPQHSPRLVFGADQLVCALTPWPETPAGRGRRAAINAFGFGGCNAHLILEQGAALSELANLAPSAPEQGSAQARGLAITGMGLHFGGCDSLSDFDRASYNGASLLRPLPAERWKGLERDPELRAALCGGAESAPHGAYLDSFEFDFLHYRVPPNPEDRLIPQQLLLLKTADAAVREAGLARGANVAVIVGVTMDLEMHQYDARLRLAPELVRSLERGLGAAERAALESALKDALYAPARLNLYTSMIGNIMASRVASHWDFTGPTFTVSAGDNSVFRALELARLLLERSEVEAVVVAGVELSGSFESLALRRARGPIHVGPPGLSFEASVRGWAPGEGAGAVVLERTRDAHAQAKRVWAHVDGLAVRPGAARESVRDAAQAAWREARIVPADVEYLELGASGSAELDQSELAGLCDAYGGAGPLHCAIGSVKSLIGHTCAASGIAALIRTALCLHHRYLPVAPNWQRPRADTPLEGGPFYVPPRSRAWVRDDGTRARSACISALERDASCHVVLSEPARRELAVVRPSLPESLQLIPLAFETRQELLQAFSELEQELAQARPLSALAAARYAAFQARPKAPYRAALLAGSAQELRRELQLVGNAIAEAGDSMREVCSPAGSYVSFAPLGADHGVTFVYAGAFNTYFDAGQDLFRLFPESFDYVRARTAHVAQLFDSRLVMPRSLEQLDSAGLLLRQRALLAEPVPAFEHGILLAVLYTELFRHVFKLRPEAAFGFSMGEISMLYALGVWATTDEMSRRLRESPIFRTELAGPMHALRRAWGIHDNDLPSHELWRGYALRAAPERVQAELAREPEARLILINSPSEVVIAGRPAACVRVIERLGCEALEAAVGDLIHCDLVLPQYEGLAALHQLPAKPVSDIRFMTAVGYRELAVAETDLGRNVADMYCQPVDFPRLVRTAYAAGSRIFVELGPRDSCARYIGETLRGEPHLAVATDRKGIGAQRSILQALAKLLSHHVPLDISPLYANVQPELARGPGLKLPVTVGGAPIERQLSALQRASAPAAPVPRATGGAQPSLVVPSAAPSIAAPAALPVAPPAAAEIGAPAVFAAAAEAGPSIAASASRVAASAAAAGTLAVARVEHGAQVVALPRPGALARPGSPLVARRMGQLASMQVRLSDAHRGFVSRRRTAMQQTVALMAAEADEILARQSALAPRKRSLAAAPEPRDERALPAPAEARASAPRSPGLARSARVDRLPGVVWDLTDLTTFAEGRIADVFGPDFAPIDAYRRRVRLPTSEYLLVTRVTELAAQPGRYEPSSIVTEYDIPRQAWYSSRGQIPWAVAVESGQCDLLLISYLGIDFQNRGERVYRLLDCRLTFLDRLPSEGETLRYEIHIDSFARQGDALLFFFRYDCFVGTRPVLKMDGGVAGFFSDAELAAGRGVIRTSAEERAREQVVKRSFAALLPCDKRSFDEADMLALCNGDVRGCYQRAHQADLDNPDLVFSAPKMLMIDRIVSVEPGGGAWGLGLVVGEKTLHPDHWYFPCHFLDDQVMAGSLMADGCSQLLRFFLLYLGMHAAVRDARFEPLRNEPQRVRCRGQVTPQHGVLSYRMEITELGTEPLPYAKANVEIVLNGKVVVDFHNLGVCLEGTPVPLRAPAPSSPAAEPSQASAVPSALAGDASSAAGEDPELSRWPTHMPGLRGDYPGVRIPTYAPGLYPVRRPPFAPFPGNPLDLNCEPDVLPFTWYHFTEFATGRVANGFGPDFRCYDEREPPRTPNGALQLVTRVLEATGERLNLKREASLVSEFDCPRDAWFLAQNSHPSWTPYSMFMEFALQTCGFVSAWAGSTLVPPVAEVFIRNLDGTGKLLAHVDVRDKTIRNHSKLLSTTRIGTTMIQNFTFELSVDGQVFFTGDTVFGYFNRGQLTQQAGLDKGARIAPWHRTPAAEGRTPRRLALRDASARAALPNVRAPYLRLGDDWLNYVDFVDILAPGGKTGLGYLYAERRIDRNEWFFPCHFHRDPVMPGSLGIQAMIEMMQVFALEQDLAQGFVRPRFNHALETTRWKYRGQITPSDTLMNVDVHITAIERSPGRVVIRADGNLAKDGLRIYEASGLVVTVEETRD